MFSTLMQRFTALLVVVSFLFAVSFRAYRLLRNYLIARKLGLPMVILPFSMMDLGWLFVRQYFMWLQYLPFGLGNWVNYTYHGWVLDDNCRIHHALGDAIVLVSPTMNEIKIADAVAGVEVVSRYKTWTKEPEMYSLFDIFGKNLVSANYPDWQRHRKITGPAFRESNYKLVWDESVRQTRQMIDLLLATRPINALDAVRADYSLIAMHVLAAAEFGKKYEYAGGLRHIEHGHGQSYANALNTVLQSMLYVLLASKGVPSFLFGKKLRKVKDAMVELRQYLVEAVREQEGTSLAASSAMKGADLVGALVHANEAAKYEENKTGGQRMHLSDDEVYGNLFVFNVAGYETTAGTLTFATPWLAAYPEVQEWVREEVDTFIKTDFEVDYETTFPKMVRCLAVMYETLRLYPPAVHLARLSNDSQSTTLHLHAENRDIHVPPKTLVSPNVIAIQRNTKHWGADATEWRPQRWIENSEAGVGKERLKEPPSDAAGFMPWAVGPRVCPGKKFSQAEFVAVISTILRKCQLAPAKGPVKFSSTEEARENLMEVARDCKLMITTYLKRPEDASVMLVPRG